HLSSVTFIRKSFRKIPLRKRFLGLSMVPMPRILATAVALIAAAAIGPATSEASYRVGIGDQHASSFDDPLFNGLGFRYARLIVPWDALSVPEESAQVDAWLARAKVTGT